MLTAVGFWTLGRLTATKNTYRPSTRQSSWWAACFTTPLDRKLLNGLEWTIPMSKPLSLRMQLPLVLCPWCWWCLQCLDCFGNSCDQLEPSCESVNAAKALLRETVVCAPTCVLVSSVNQRCTVNSGVRVRSWPVYRCWCISSFSLSLQRKSFFLIECSEFELELRVFGSTCSRSCQGSLWYIVI